MIDAVERLITRVPGRLAVVAIVAGTIFSAVSGSTIAITAMLGSLMVPLMIERGYHPIMATGPIMAVGALDMLMPVSALAVLLGSLSGISIPKLLIGGFVPGMVLKAIFVVYIVLPVAIKVIAGLLSRVLKAAKVEPTIVSLGVSAVKKKNFELGVFSFELKKLQMLWPQNAQKTNALLLSSYVLFVRL